MDIYVEATDLLAANRGAEWMARRMRSALGRRGVCRVAVSGGSTPVMMFEHLAAIDVAWSSVHIFQVDERVAPDGDPDRNSVQLMEFLIDRIPIKESNVHLMPVTSSSLPAAAARYAAEIGSEPLDVVHLGIGDDGHTASWAPGDPVIDDPNPIAISAPYKGRLRMTMTPHVVNAARARMVLATGVAKAEPIAGWLLHRADLPIERVRRTNTTLIADVAATAHLVPHAQPAR